ncbi:MAG: hypothetical protein ACTS4Y_02055, partial [Candidatus Hodgkinia cicadicola]
PLGSVKDRIANALIDDLVKRKNLTPGGVIVEASSGNTGIVVLGLKKAYTCKCTYESRCNHKYVERLMCIQIKKEKKQENKIIFRELCKVKDNKQNLTNKEI